MYRVPVIKRLIDSSPADAIFLEANDDLQEDPFLLANVLRYLGLPDQHVGQCRMMRSKETRA